SVVVSADPDADDVTSNGACTFAPCGASMSLMNEYWPLIAAVCRLKFPICQEDVGVITTLPSWAIRVPRSLKAPGKLTPPGAQLSIEICCCTNRSVVRSPPSPMLRPPRPPLDGPPPGS